MFLACNTKMWLFLFSQLLFYSLQSIRLIHGLQLWFFFLTTEWFHFVRSMQNWIILPPWMTYHITFVMSWEPAREVKTNVVVIEKRCINLDASGCSYIQVASFVERPHLHIQSSTHRLQQPRIIWSLTVKTQRCLKFKIWTVESGVNLTCYCKSFFFFLLRVSFG